MVDVLLVLINADLLINVMLIIINVVMEAVDYLNPYVLLKIFAHLINHLDAIVENVLKVIITVLMKMDVLS